MCWLINHCMYIYVTLTIISLVQPTIAIVVPWDFLHLSSSDSAIYMYFLLPSHPLASGPPPSYLRNHNSVWNTEHDNTTLLRTPMLQAVYYVKRRPEQVKKDNFHDLIMFGDLSHLPLDHFTSLMDTVGCLDTQHAHCATQLGYGIHCIHHTLLTCY